MLLTDLRTNLNNLKRRILYRMHRFVFQMQTIRFLSPAVIRKSESSWTPYSLKILTQKCKNRIHYAAGRKLGEYCTAAACLNSHAAAQIASALLSHFASGCSNWARWTAGIYFKRADSKNRDAPYKTGTRSGRGSRTQGRDAFKNRNALQKDSPKNREKPRAPIQSVHSLRRPCKIELMSLADGMHTKW